MFAIGKTLLAPETKPYIIAEIGNNHGGDPLVALDMVESAAMCGANAVKFQRRNIEKLYTKEQLSKPYDNPNSFGRTYGEHRKALELNLSDLKNCKAAADELGIDFLCTVFETESLGDIYPMVPALKVASASIANHELLWEISQHVTHAVIVSTGGATSEEIAKAVEILSPCPTALLQCTALYPCPAEKINLRGMQWLAEKFHCMVGYSGHDTGIAIPLAAYVMGARIIEKHFTLNRAAKGTDHAMSLEPQGLRTLVENINKVHQAMGSHGPVVYDDERAPLEKMGKLYAKTTY